MNTLARVVNWLTPHKAAIGTGLLAAGFALVGDRHNATAALLALLVQLGFITLPTAPAPR